MADHRLHRHLSHRATRRNVLRGAGASLTLAAATPFFRTGAGAATLRQTPTTMDISGTNLSILLWSHFVPRHDEWFDQFVAEWGEANRPRALDMLKILDDQLAKHPFIAGANFSVADITAMVAVDFMKPAKIEIPTTLVNVVRWHKDVSARPSAKA